MKILVFGDSITQGFWDMSGGWPAKLKKYSDKKFDGDYNKFDHVFPLGISGETTQGVLNRLQNEVESRTKPTDDFMIIFATGVNDTRVTSGVPETHIRDFSQNIQALLDLAHKYTDRVLIVGLTPVIDDRTTPLSWNDQIHYTQQRVLEYDMALRIIAEANKVDYVDVMNPLLELQKKEESMSDGIHPEKNGHALMYKLIKKHVAKLKR